eukprot:5675753-Lingulodinium_polyedra.AAC.1
MWTDGSQRSVSICGRVQPTVLAQCLREAGYPTNVTQRARQLYCELCVKHKAIVPARPTRVG